MSDKICFAFEVHQPFRLGEGFQGCNFSNWFSDSNREVLLRVAEKCYIPATQIILEKLDDGFKCAFSLSGLVVEQMEMWCEEALDLFKECAKHRNCEFLAQTYFHSIASLFSEVEFEKQVRMHSAMLREKFGVKAKVVENTELIFNSSIAAQAARLGFKAIYAEGCEKLLKGRSPNYVYTCGGIKVLVRNYRLSDDIAFRFSCREWDQYPLTAEKYAEWLSKTPGDCINIFIDYETFGEHHWKETGILEFLRWLPYECERRGLSFALPSEVAELKVAGELDATETTSWADLEKDVSAWLGNDMQKSALKAVEKAEPYARRDGTGKKMWRLLQTSDHFYYMATKHGSSGEVHSYFSQSEPFKAFRNYMLAVNAYEECCIPRMKEREAARILRTLKPENGFHFFEGNRYVTSAYSLPEFAEKLKEVSEKCIREHHNRGDFERWISECVGDRKLSRLISSANCGEVVKVVEERVQELWSLLK